ncbi:hypothetical protein Tco_0258901, partial [Tanacetum coccineum]
LCEYKASQGNPSPLFASLHYLTIEGDFGLSVLSGWRVIGAMGRWEWVGLSWEWYLGGGMGVKPWGRGCLVLAGTMVGCRV